MYDYCKTITFEHDLCKDREYGDYAETYRSKLIIHTIYTTVHLFVPIKFVIKRIYVYHLLLTIRSDVFQYVINWLTFVIEAHCVLCEVH
jgi:hypothetical protein